MQKMAVENIIKIFDDLIRPEAVKEETAKRQIKRIGGGIYGKG